MAAWWAIPAAASLATTIFGRGDEPEASYPQFDITSELERISHYYKQQKNYLQKFTYQNLGEMNKILSTNLAGRGIYSSPVSEYMYGRARQTAMQDLTKSYASLAEAEGKDRSNVFSSLMGYQYNVASANLNRNIAKYSARQQTTNMLSSALMSAAMQMAMPQQAPQQPAQQMPQQTAALPNWAYSSAGQQVNPSWQGIPYNY